MPKRLPEKNSPGNSEDFGLRLNSRSAEDEAAYEAARKEKLTAAAEAAKAISAGKTYKLKRKDSAKPFRILTIGCHGQDNKDQRAVADAMAQFDDNDPPDLVLFLGDNFYKKIDSADDKQFETFNKIYEKLSKKNIPFFMMLGNHDYGYENPHVKTLSGHYDPDETPSEIAGYQIHHTYLDEPEKVKAIFDKEEIALSELNNIWNLPAPYYALVDEESKTRIICLDSNTYVRDYLNLSANSTPDNNQAVWLKKQMEVANEKKEKCIIALHHPVITPGKRAYDNKSDAKYYLEEEEIKKIKGEFNNLRTDTPSYNAMLSEIFKKQGINPSLFVAAHDHMIFYGHDEKGEVKQVIAGGGGGKVQDQLSFPQKSAICLKQHGFVQLMCEEKSPDIDIRIEAIRKNKDTPAHHLHYTTASIEPKRNDSGIIDEEEKSEITELKKAVIAGIKNYQSFLQKNQDANSGKFFSWPYNLSHGSEGVIRAQQLMAYLSEEKSDNYMETVERIFNFLYESSQSRHSLEIFVNRALAPKLEKLIRLDFERTTEKTPLKLLHDDRKNHGRGIKPIPQEDLAALSTKKHSRPS